MKKTFISIGLAMVIGLALLLGVPLAQKSSAQLPGGLNVKDLKKLKKGVDTVKALNDASKPWTYPEERATGRVVAAQVAEQFGGIWQGTPSAQAWNDYVNKVGRALVPYSNRPDIKYRFAVLNSDVMNAFSCPGGYTFVTKGFLKAASNEAELAGVLAHEIGHVSQRHVENTIRTQQVAGTLMNAGLDFAALDGQLNAQQVNAIKQTSKGAWDVLISKGMSQKDEFEADAVGAKNMQRLGYDPNALGNFLGTLKDQKAKGDWSSLLKTHPPASKRQEKINELIQQSGWSGGQTHEDRFNAMKQKNPL